MEFLNQSWANIVEDDEAEARLLAELEKETDANQQLQYYNADDFQLVPTKYQMKEQRRLLNLAKNTYQTFQMKFLCWNARGLANPSSRLVLKRLVFLHKPNFLLLAKPWMHIDKFPKRWLRNLDLKTFCSKF